VILSQLPPPQTSLFEAKTKPKSPSPVKRNFGKRVREILCEDQLEDIINLGADIIIQLEINFPPESFLQFPGFMFISIS